jgi:hypothetical protein
MLSGDPESRFYVEKRGPYVLARSEMWPPVEPDGPPRVLLTFRAWPHVDYGERRL